MSTFYSVFSGALLLGYWLLIALVTLRILTTRRTVSSALAWLLVVYILPLIGIIAYLAFGEFNLGRRRSKLMSEMWPSVAQWLQKLKNYPTIFSDTYSDVAAPLFQLCKHRQGIEGIKGNKLKLLTTADETLKTIVEDIQLAKDSIEMVFYIWQMGGLVDDVAKALIDAANRGVKVRIMVDSAGSHHFFRSKEPKRLRDAGIELIEALKVNIFRVFLRRMDLRQHRKVVIIDNHISYTGSMNMVDPRYFKQSSGVGEWIDIMVRMEGPVATPLGMFYACDWRIETDKIILPPQPQPELMPYPDEEGHSVQVIASGPGFPKDMILQALLVSIYSAREELILTTPYFVPSEDLFNAICTAALRGVKVKLILPYTNDSILVRWASRAFFAEMLAAGVEIHKFKGGLLHSKCVLVDRQLSLVGTVNLDMRSLWLNYEVTLAVDDAEFGNKLYQVKDHYLADCIKIEPAEWKNRPFWHRIIERIFYFFSPLL